MLMSSDADVNAEIAGLQAAKRRACVRVLESDVSKGIVVMERLGSPIAESGLTIQSQISKVTRALQESWQADTNRQDLVPGERKVDWLENHLRHSPSKIGMSFERKMIHRALVLIENRRAAWQKKFYWNTATPISTTDLRSPINKQATAASWVQTAWSWRLPKILAYCCAIGLICTGKQTPQGFCSAGLNCRASKPPSKKTPSLVGATKKLAPLGSI